MPTFPNLHGLETDSVLNHKVVLADSTIVNANKATNSDLHCALKGGGCNFGGSTPLSGISKTMAQMLMEKPGIVTRFDLQTYPTIKVQYTMNLYDPSDYVNIL